MIISRIVDAIAWTILITNALETEAEGREMMPDALYSKLNGLRNEYRAKMNRSAEAAQAAAQAEEMHIVSMCSTDSERYREAFHALNRAIQIIEEEQVAS